MNDSKVCRCCNLSHPLQNFIVNSKYGATNVCRQCHNLEEGYRKHKKRVSEEKKLSFEEFCADVEMRRELLKLGIKICKQCELKRDTREYYKGNAVCKSCQSENGKAKYKKNPTNPTRQARAEHYKKNLVRYLWWGARQRARDRHLPIDITPEYLQELWNKQGGCCALSKIPFDLECPKFNVKGSHRPSLDRIDSAGGYTMGNVRYVLWILNVGMADYGEAVYLEVARAVLANRG